MKNHNSIARRAIVVLGVSVIAVGSILGDWAPALAQSAPDQVLTAADESAVQQKGMMKPMGEDPCSREGVPCAKYIPPRPGGLDRASDGSACTSGAACRAPGAGCGPGANVSGRCTTIPLGGGRCDCGCMF